MGRDVSMQSHPRATKTPLYSSVLRILLLSCYHLPSLSMYVVMSIKSQRVARVLIRGRVSGST